MLFQEASNIIAAARGPVKANSASFLLDVPYGKYFFITLIVHYFLWLKNSGSCLVSGNT